MSRSSRPIQVGFKAGWAWDWCMPVQASSSKSNLLQKGAVDQSNEPRATANLLTIYKQTGEFQAAEELIDALDEEQLQHPDIRKAIADLRIAEGDNVAASHHLAELAASHPNRAETG